MKNILFIAAIIITSNLFAQTDSVQLTNALVVAQMDNQQERYALESALVEIFEEAGIVTEPGINYVNIGGDATVLASDSVQNDLKSKGVDTYVIVSVRGYDRKFKPSERRDSLEQKLSEGNLYELYRLDIVSVSFEFTFYKNGEYIGNDVVKCGNISDRGTVLKRFRKKVSKRLYKKWKA